MEKRRGKGKGCKGEEESQGGEERKGSLKEKKKGKGAKETNEFRES